MGKGAFRAVPTICQLSSLLKWWARLRFAHPLKDSRKADAVLAPN
jgi:hypothetical protein